MPPKDSQPPPPHRPRRERAAPAPERPDVASTAMSPGAIEGEAARLAVDLARDQLAEQLAAIDGDDVKALGFLAVEIAAMASLFASRRSLDSLWWLPSIGFGLAAALLMGALSRRRFRPGKEPLEVYFTDSKTPALDVVLALRAARLQIVQIRGSRWRRWPYNLSLVLLAVSVVGGGLTLLGVH